MDNTGKDLTAVLMNALDAAMAVPRPVVVRHIAQTRRTRPTATPGEVCKALERRFLAAVTISGVAAGGAGAAPGVGTPVAITIAAGDALAFIGAAGMLALSYAEMYGVRIDDVERRRMLILAVLLGDSGAATVTRIAERTGKHWGRHAVNAIPIETIRAINRVLGPNFVTRYGSRQGILVLGKAVPFGIGALIGGGGNALLGRATVEAARRTFGSPPPTWPVTPTPMGPDHGDRGTTVLAA